MKELIIFYSRKGENYTVDGMKNLEIGNTKIIANMIKEIRNADIFEVETINEYPLNYHDCTVVAKEELEKNIKPELKKYLTDISEYETIYIGYPNWWGTIPMALVNQLERLDFTGKTIKPFCTHEGSKMGDSLTDLKKLCPSAIIKEGLPIQGSYVNEATQQVSSWLNN